MQKLRYAVAVIGLALALPMIGVIAQDTAPLTPAQICENSVPAAEPATREYAAAGDVLQPGIDYRAVFCTDAGAVYIDLFEDLTPETVNNFVFLAQNGYYNNTIFHRVIADFMVQGGDPTGTGSGGPGYQFADEFVGFLTFDQPGWLAMANAGPGTNGSQFFITTVPTPHLDFRHTIFGQVIEGQDTVSAIQLRDPAVPDSPSTALQTVVIVTDPTSVTTTHTAPAPATQEDLLAVIDSIGAELPATLGVNNDVTGIKTAENVVASAPESVREAYSALLSENNFAYRASIQVDNTSCQLADAPFLTVHYTMDVFASREDATAVIATAASPDGVLYRAQTEAGLAVLEAETALPYPVFIGTTQGCDQEMTRAITYWQRGNYVITAEAVYPISSQATADVWLQQLVGVQIFERLFADVLRATLG